MIEMTTTMPEENILKKNQKLPQEVQQFFATADKELRNELICRLYEKGWTFEAISNGSDVTRERVRQIVKLVNDNDGRIDNIDFPFEVPEPPRRPVKKKREIVEPHPDTLARLLELQPYAQQVRSNGTKYRVEAEEYTRLLNHAHTVEGVTLYRLAKRLGVTHGALRFRLVRYGYKQPVTATSKVYAPIKADNRIQK
jgi:hypothetical protein